MTVLARYATDAGADAAARRRPPAAPRWRDADRACSSAPSPGCSGCSRWRRTAPPTRRFSTSGSGGADRSNKAGVARRLALRQRASSWSAIRSGGRSLVGARAWLGALARVLRGDAAGAAGAADAALPAWPILARPGAAARRQRRRSNGRACTSGKARSPAATPAACSATSSARASQKPARLRRLGRALDRGAGRRRRRWPSLLLAARGRAHRRAASSRCATRRVERIERAEDVRLGEQAMREREEMRRGRARAAGAAPADRDRADAGRRAEEHARRQGAPEAAVHRAGRHQAAAGRPARRGAAAPVETVTRRDARDDLAPDREEAQGLRRRGARGRRPRPGPVITRYEIEPATGVKGAQVVNLAKDLARSLSLVSIRVVETIPGKNDDGARAAQRQAADDPPVRDPRLAGLQRRRARS